MSNDTKACWKDRSPFTSEDNKEAMTKAFVLFAYCMASGPCNNCAFFNISRLPEDPCAIGCPNSWTLFDTSTENGTKNRNLVLDALRRKEEKND